MAESIARRGFLLRLLGFTSAGATAGLAIGKTVKFDRPVLWFDGRSWHTHEKIRRFEGTWEIRWCYRPKCEHTIQQAATKEDAAGLPGAA